MTIRESAEMAEIINTRIAAAVSEAIGRERKQIAVFVEAQGTEYFRLANAIMAGVYKSGPQKMREPRIEREADHV